VAIVFPQHLSEILRQDLELLAFRTRIVALKKTSVPSLDPFRPYGDVNAIPFSD